MARARPLTAITDLIDRAGLQGRGGAGFPTAVKMRSVAGGRGRAVVLANGTEGEPASYKDRLLLTHRSHLVVDGALLAAAAVGAHRVVIGVEETAGQALGALRRALAERASSEPAGIGVEVVATPPGYVSGEESALVTFVNGRAALPTAVPPVRAWIVPSGNTAMLTTCSRRHHDAGRCRRHSDVTSMAMSRWRATMPHVTAPGATSRREG